MEGNIVRIIIFFSLLFNANVYIHMPYIRGTSNKKEKKREKSRRKKWKSKKYKKKGNDKREDNILQNANVVLYAD